MIAYKKKLYLSPRRQRTAIKPNTTTPHQAFRMTHHSSAASTNKTIKMAETIAAELHRRLPLRHRAPPLPRSRPLPRESENLPPVLSPHRPPRRPHRPAPRCTPAPPRAARSAPRAGGCAAAARRRAALLKFRFRSLAVISRPRALRQACVSRDAPLLAARSISLASRSRHGTAPARRHRRTRGGGHSRVLRPRRVPPAQGARAHRGRGSRAMQQRHVRRRPVHAQRVFRAMGRRRARVPQVLRPSAIVV